MAWTVSHNVTVWGNKVVDIMKVTADAATQVIQTKCGVIEGFSASVISAASGGPTVGMNLNASSALANGSLFCKSFTTGDDFCIVVYGH